MESRAFAGDRATSFNCVVQDSPSVTHIFWGRTPVKTQTAGRVLALGMGAALVISACGDDSGSKASTTTAAAAATTAGSATTASGGRAPRRPRRALTLRSR